MRFKERTKTTGGIDKANRLKIEDGKSIDGVFRGDPYEFEQHWTGKFPTECPGRATCTECKAGDKPFFRFRINFIVKENGAYTAKVFEQGWRVYTSLKALHDAGYELEKTTVIVARTGSTKQDTKYTITPKPKGELSELVDKALSQIPLHSLENQPDGPDTTDTETVAEEDHDEVPF